MIRKQRLASCAIKLPHCHLLPPLSSHQSRQFHKFYTNHMSDALQATKTGQILLCRCCCNCSTLHRLHVQHTVLAKRICWDSPARNKAHRTYRSTQRKQFPMQLINIHSSVIAFSGYKDSWLAASVISSGEMSLDLPGRLRICYRECTA